MQRPAGARRAATAASCVGRDRPHRVDRGADPQARSLGQRGDPGGPGVGVAVGEPALDAVQRQVAGAVEAAGEVAGVEQGEPDAGVGRGLRSAPRDIAFGSAYGAPPGAWCR